MTRPQTIGSSKATYSIWPPSLRLEEKLGTRLLQRSTRSLAVTEVGRELYFESALKERGNQARLNILVNNTGIGHFGKVSDATEQNFDDVFTANTKTPFLVTKSALQYLAAGARVINISSGASKRPGTLFGLYAMAKAAVDAMTLALAAELGPRGITVNTVAPGWTATDANASARQDVATVSHVESQTALGRLGTPDDIARVVAFLASDDGGWVTGQYIEASGGFKLL